MGLPELIEIEPLNAPVEAEIPVPGSKSVTNRALVLAALAEGPVRLQGALWSEDTQVMTEALRRLGFRIEVAPDPCEPCNRILLVHGQGGRVPPGGTEKQPLELYTANAGTAARFLAALAALGTGVYRLDGAPRMRERPQAGLFQALRSLGCRVDSPNERLPATIHGIGRRPGTCRVSLAQSSQFASALLLAGHAGRWRVEIEDEDEEAGGYVEMTRRIIEVFPFQGGEFAIEPDASSGSYFLAADWLLRRRFGQGRVQVRNWPSSGWQVDQQFTRFLPPRRTVSRRTDLGDSILTAMILAPFGEAPVQFVDLGRLRVQECERVRAMRTELTRCGCRVEESGDTLTIHPSPARGATIETYNDHRIAMAFAALGLFAPGMRIRSPACVSKTFPNFFAKLAAPPPEGLGARLRDAETGRLLKPNGLTA